MTESDKIWVRVIDEGTDKAELAPPPAKGVEEQAFWNRKPPSVDKLLDTEAVGSGIRDITTKLKRSLEGEEAAAPKGSFQLDSFTVGLAINASGTIVLVGSLGVEASIQVTFKRA